MSTTNTLRSRFVGAGFVGGPRALLCLIAFLATGAVVIWMGRHQAGRAEWYAATATIRHRSNPSANAEGPPSNRPIGPDPATVQAQIASDQNLRHALGRLDLRTPDQGSPDPWDVTNETVEQVRRQLRVASAKELWPPRLGVSVTYRDVDPDRALKLVNALAQGYAEQHRAKLEATVRQDHHKARDAAEVARQVYVEAKARFDEFVAQHFLAQRALAQREVQRRTEPDSVEGPMTSGSAGGAIEVPPQQPIMAPEQVELETRLAELQEHRAQLLLSRTPAHPEVQYVDSQIAQLEQRRASMPGGAEGPLAPPASEGPALAPPPMEGVSERVDTVEPDETLEEYAEAARAYDAHKDALDRARQEYDRLSEAKRRAWERELRATRVELDLAAEARLDQGADRPPPSLLGALAAALAVALGVGMISSGFDTDVPLRTATEVQRALRVPVVGRIPARESSPAPAIGQRSRRVGQLAKILGGTLLVAVCFGILVVVL